MKSSLIVSQRWGRKEKDVQQGHTAWNFFSSRILGSLILLFILQHPLVSIDGRHLGYSIFRGPPRSRRACFCIVRPEDVEPHDCPRDISDSYRSAITLSAKKSKRVSLSLSAISEAEDVRTEVCLKVTNHPNNNNTQSCLVYHPLYNGNHTRDRECPLQKAYNRSQRAQTKRKQERSIWVAGT